MTAYFARFHIFALLLVVMALGGNSQGQGGRDKPLNVRYCTLVYSPEEYANKIVRFSAYMSYSTVTAVHGDTSIIYGAECNADDYFSAVRYIRNFKSREASKIFKAVPEESIAMFAVTITGKFDYNIVPTFGDLSWAINQITIHKIESIQNVTSRSEVLKSTYRAERTRIDFGNRLKVINTELMFLIVNAKKPTTELTYIADDFSLTDTTGSSYTKDTFMDVVARGIFSEPGNIATTGVTGPRIEIRNGLYHASGFVIAKNDGGEEYRLKYHNIYRRHQDSVLLIESKLTRP